MNGQLQNDLWEEYADDEQARVLNICTNCDGLGHLGIEPETGCFYTCYRCFNTGNYFVYKVRA